MSEVVAPPDPEGPTILDQDTDTQAIDFAWESSAGSSGRAAYREPLPTLLDPDPLRHDQDDQPRSQVDTVPDADPLQYDLPDEESVADAVAGPQVKD